jgi:hypothetical protein
MPRIIPYRLGRGKRLFLSAALPHWKANSYHPAEDGYTFTVAELDAVLKESGDSFEKFGNPAKRSIWWV